MVVPSGTVEGSVPALASINQLVEGLRQDGWHDKS